MESGNRENVVKDSEDGSLEPTVKSADGIHNDTECVMEEKNSNPMATSQPTPPNEEEQEDHAVPVVSSDAGTRTLEGEIYKNETDCADQDANIDDKSKEIYNEEEDISQPPLLIVSRSSEAPALISVDSESMSVQWNPASTTVETQPGQVLDFYLLYELQMQLLDVDDPTHAVVDDERWSVQYSGRATYVQVAGLRPGRSYAVRVGYCPVVEDSNVVIDNAPPSGVLVVSTTPTPPLPPETMLLTVRQRNAIKIKWTEPDENGGHSILYYRVECYPRPENHDGKPSSNGMYEVYCGKERSLLLKKLLPGVQYNLRVKAVNAIGESSWSKISSFKTQPSVPSTPDAPVVASVTPNSVVLLWPPVSSNGADVSGYQVEMDDGEGSDLQMIARTHEPQFSTTKLRGGLMYRVRIRAENSEGFSQWSPVCHVRTTSSPPSKPNPPRRLQATTSAIVLAWSPPELDGGSPISRYIVEMSPSTTCKATDDFSLGNWKIIYSGSQLKYTVRGLRAGFVYKVRVKAENDTGESSYSNEVEVHTASSVPEAPEGLRAVHRSQDSVQLRWNPPRHNGGSEIKSYKIEYRMLKRLEEEVETESESGMFQTGIECIECDTTIRDLEPGTCYEFRCVAENNLGLSPYSCSASAETKPGLPFAPEILSVVPGSNFGSLEVSWQRPYGHGAVVNSYVLQTKPCNSQTSDGQAIKLSNSNESQCLASNNCSDRGCLQEIFDSDAANRTQKKQSSEMTGNEGYTTVYQGPACSCTVEDLIPDCNYMVRVQGGNSVGYGSWSREKLGKTGPAPPSNPQNLQIHQASEVALEVKWNPPRNSFGSRVSRYELQYAHFSRGKRSGLTWNPGYIGTELLALIIGLRPGQSYRIRVRASNECGWGEWSDEIIGDTAATLPGPPDPPTCSSKNSNTIRVSWNPPIEINGAAIKQYELKMWDLSEEKSFSKFVYKGPDLTYKVSQLLPATEYGFSVRAVNAVGPGPFSNQGYGKTRQAPPLQPNNVSVKQLRDKSGVTVSWEHPSESAAHFGCSSFEIEAMCIKRTEPSCHHKLDSSNHSMKKSCNGRETEIELTDLVPGEYRIRVRGIGMNNSGHGTWSDPIDIWISGFETMDNGVSLASIDREIVASNHPKNNSGNQMISSVSTTKGKLERNNARHGTKSGISTKPQTVSKTAVAKPRPKTQSRIARLLNTSDKNLIRSFVLLIVSLAAVFFFIFETESGVDLAA